MQDHRKNKRKLEGCPERGLIMRGLLYPDINDLTNPYLHSCMTPQTLGEIWAPIQESSPKSGS
jgi:hypothetical protein